MKHLLFDQNLSPRLVDRLAEWFPDSVHVERIGLARASDREVWSYAQRNDYMLVTKDADFGEMSLLMGTAPKVVWIRRGNCSTQDIEDLLRSNSDSIDAFSNDPEARIIELF